MTEIIYDESIAGASSAFDSAFYDAERETVYINFWNGTVIGYSGFQKSDWNRFNGAMSKGSFYNTQMKAGWKFPAKYCDDVTAFVKRKPEPETTELNYSPESSVNITVNVFFSGDPEAIAKAVERLAPSIRAINQFGVK